MKDENLVFLLQTRSAGSDLLHRIGLPFFFLPALGPTLCSVQLFVRVHYESQRQEERSTISSWSCRDIRYVR
jgi:hypothetical protein